MTSKKTSTIPHQIISALNKKSDIRFKEFKDMLNISGQTLSIHLKALLEENTITFEKKGREKHYRLNKKSIKNSHRKVEIFSSNHINQIERLVRFGVYDMDDYFEDDKIIPEEHYKKLVDMIGTYFLFTLFKGLETGENWFDGFDKKWLGTYILDSFCGQAFEHFEISELSDHLVNNNFDKFYKEANAHLDKKGKKMVKTIFENIEYMYGEHFDALKKSLREDYKYKVNL